MKLKYVLVLLQEDDERTIEEDEAQITDSERREELKALQAEADLPLEELLKSYNGKTGESQGLSVDIFVLYQIHMHVIILSVPFGFIFSILLGDCSS